MPRMDPWKRYRLLACIVVMLGMLATGLIGRLYMSPEPPCDPVDYPVWNDRSTNPFDRLARYYESDLEIIMREAARGRRRLLGTP